jgi:hypothetical protein
MAGDINNADWKQSYVLSGRAFMLQFGDEDAPVASTGSIDDQLAMATVDVPSGTTIIPMWGQGVVGTWTTGALINYMIEVDNGKVRRSSGGTAFTPICLRTDKKNGTGSAGVSGCTAYVAGASDIVAAAKTSGGSLEVYRESIEVNTGDAADYWPKMEYNPVIAPVVVGPASVVVHFGASADLTVYGNLMWAEFPTAHIVAP